MWRLWGASWRGLIYSRFGLCVLGVIEGFAWVIGWGVEAGDCLAKGNVRFASVLPSTGDV